MIQESKLYPWTLALLFTLLSPWAMAQSEENPSQQVKSEFLLPGGSNVGGGVDPTARLLIEWCNGSVGVLGHYKGMAQIQVLNSKFNEANRLLKTGILEALKSEDAKSTVTHRTLMFRSLTRGLEIVNAIEGLQSTAGVRISDEDVYRAFSNYYNFVTTVVADLDRDFYITYWSYLQRKPQDAAPTPWNENHQKQFETRFVDYAKSQLKWVNGNFATNTPQFGATPKGHTKIYLTIAELMTKFVKDDLADPENLFFLKYACVIKHLGYLNATLASFNLGNRAELPDERIAVNYIFHSIGSFDGEIKIQNVPTGCKF